MWEVLTRIDYIIQVENVGSFDQDWLYNSRGKWTEFRGLHVKDECQMWHIKREKRIKCWAHGLMLLLAATFGFRPPHKESWVALWQHKLFINLLLHGTLTKLWLILVSFLLACRQVHSFIFSGGTWRFSFQNVWGIHPRGQGFETSVS
jgi:hypothetical protein